ncbi:MAG: prolyl oligopeptidase family serine peptidase [Candidatus Aminicenantes bacterium]|nr:prolyl oligopeptidase family serine peptidase [Candidatus Aminicenantes bacterium]
MKKVVLSAVLFIFCLGTIFAQDENRRPMTVDDALNMVRLRNVRMSPDGKWVFFSKSELGWGKNKRIMKHFMIPASGGEAWQYIGEAGGSSFQFSPDGKYLSFKRTVDKNSQIFIMPLSGGEAFQLTRHQNSVDSYKWSEDARRIFFSAEEPRSKKEQKEYDLGDDAVFVFEGPNGREEARWRNLWIFDLSSKEEKRLTDEKFIINEFDVSPDGKRVVFTAAPLEDDNYFHLSELYLLDLNDPKPVRLTKNKAPEGNVHWAPDGRTFVYHSPSDRDFDLTHGFLWLMNPDTGEKRKFKEPSQGGIYGLSWMPDGKSLLFSETRRTDLNLYRLDIATGKITEVTKVKGTLRALAFSKDRTRMVYSFSDFDTPPDLYVTSVGNLKPIRLTNANPWIEKELQFAKADIIHWKSKDGTEIEGVLYVPRNSQEGKKLPLIVTIHGGPPGHFANRFRAVFHIFAGLGYASLGPNIRGSDSYGDDLLWALQGDVGGGEFDDIMTGVDYLIEKGIVDSDQLGVRGWSWGGILGSWVITQTDRFKAASLGAMVGSWTAESGPGLSWDLKLHYIGGAHWINPEEWRKVSSLWYVKNVTTPTLLLHGSKDLVSTPNQAMMFFHALREIGKAPVRYINFPREPHGFREPRHQRRRDIEEIRWMQKYILGIEWKPWERKE